MRRTTRGLRRATVSFCFSLGVVLVTAFSSAGWAAAQNTSYGSETLSSNTTSTEESAFGLNAIVSDSGFIRIPGALTQISAGSVTNVWGVNAAQQIYRYTGNDANPFFRIPGALVNVSAAADGTVWGVNAAGQIFRYLYN